MALPAIVTAGDLRAARAVYGESKVYLQIAGRPLVARVVLTLQQVPEISEVWVVGNAERLEALFAQPELRAEIHKPLHIVPQFRNLFENSWETFKRALPGAPPEGREPESEEDLDYQALFISGDLPFATPQEISDFVRRGQASGADYAVGLVREDRLRQSNLHLAKPGRMGNRQYIEDMYEYRHQREWGDMVGLAWRLMRSEQGGFTILFFYILLHLAGLADRWRLRRLADWLRSAVSVARTEAAVSTLLRTRFRFVVTEVGGCAIDVDTEAEYDVVRARFEEWSARQAARAEALCGPLPLPERAGSGDPAKAAGEVIE
jgi:hypothetical protein